MIKLADADTICRIDEAAMERFGIAGLQLMENAGRGVAESVKGEILRRGRDIKGAGVIVFAGKGNNGGDGFVAARHLANAGARVEVILLVSPGELAGDSAVNYDIWRRMKGVTRSVRTMKSLEKCHSDLIHSAIIVDAIFGTGLRSPVRGFLGEVVDLINSLGKPILAVDIPSGIHATKGVVQGKAVKATVTATMSMPKLGIYTYPGRMYAGRIEVVDIGAPASLISEEKIPWNLVTGRALKEILRPRRPDTHKGIYGHLLVVGGSHGKSGAAYLTAMGAMRIGAGLVTLAVPESLYEVVETKTSEVMTMGLTESSSRTLGPDAFDELIGLLTRKSAIVVGPGLGLSSDTMAFMASMVSETGLPLVIDADGLNSIVNPSLLKKARADVVLTPHPGEMARLIKTSTAYVQANRVDSATQLARETGATVVLKGAGTVTASPDGRVYINPTGNPGLASAGTGDVLAGMIGALLAQGYPPVDASVASVYMHGLAADDIKRTRGEVGLIATDLFEALPEVINRFVGGVGG